MEDVALEAGDRGQDLGGHQRRGVDDPQAITRQHIDMRAVVLDKVCLVDSLDLEMLKVTADVRIYPGTPLADTAIAEGVIGSEDDLLRPSFYMARGVDGWIQDAINASEDGDTIRVFAGRYEENIEVNRSVSLIGNGSDVTTIYGRQPLRRWIFPQEMR